MYKYSITLEAVEVAQSTGSTQPPLQFAVVNHDDLFQIIKAVRDKRIMNDDDSAALALGLKLLTEIALPRRAEPLFAPLMGPLGSFIKELKSTSRQEDPL